MKFRQVQLRVYTLLYTACISPNYVNKVDNKQSTHRYVIINPHTIHGWIIFLIAITPLMVTVFLSMANFVNAHAHVSLGQFYVVLLEASSYSASLIINNTSCRVVNK